MTSQADGTNTTTLAYNSLDQLTAMSVNGSATSFLYGPDGSRYSRTDPANNVTTYLVDPRTQNVWAEYDTSGNLAAKNIHGDDIDELLDRLQGTSNYQALQDGLGSVTGLTDGSGALAAGYAYSAWGIQSQTTGTGTVNQPFGFAGREHEGSLLYNRARYLMPSLGRWNAQDPIGFSSGDINLHRYVNNDPVRFRDPSGNIAPIIVGGIIIGAIVAGVAIYGVGVYEWLIAKDAIKKAQDKYENDERRRRAYRHCMWACEMSSRGGGNAISATITTLHEWWDTWRVPTAADPGFFGNSANRPSQYNNNAVGRSCSKTDHDCEQACSKAMDDGRLNY